MPKPEQYVFLVDPIGKPRMTQRDKWKKRPPVARYWSYRDEVKNIAKNLGFVMPESDFHIIFYIPMPNSWRNKKRSEMNGKPHQSRPDWDNLVKAFLDAVCQEDDSHIWDGRVTKVWSNQGAITVYKLKT